MGANNSQEKKIGRQNFSQLNVEENYVQLISAIMSLSYLK